MEHLIGIKTATWKKLLKQNDYHVSLKNFRNLLLVSLHAIYNTLSAGKDEELVRTKEIQHTPIKEPLFVLGHWRSGTTLLHNLISQDGRFKSPTVFQVKHPWTFLSQEDSVYRSIEKYSGTKRPMDNVIMRPNSPGEDEFALSSMCLMSPLVGWSFPENEKFYDRFLAFDEVTESEVEIWKNHLLLFFKKVTWKYQKPLLLKSPPHTARIRHLLEIFPDARFINLTRNPYDVFVSTRKLFMTGVSTSYLQRKPTDKFIEEAILRRYRMMYDSFFRDVGLIPEGQFYQLKFEDLENDLIGSIYKIYNHFSFEFSEIEEKLSIYVESIKNYQKNNSISLDQKKKSEIYLTWKSNFDTWNYPE